MPSRSRKPGKTVWPSHWTPGQLLDVQKFHGPIYRMTLLGEKFNSELANAVTFRSSDDAMGFLAWWYAPPEVRDHGRPS